MSDRIVTVINVNRIVGEKAVSMARAQNLTEIDVDETTASFLISRRSRKASH